MTTTTIIVLSVLSTLIIVGLVAAMLAVRSKVNRLEDEMAKNEAVEELHCRIADLENRLSNQLDRADNAFCQKIDDIYRDVQNRMESVNKTTEELRSIIDRRVDKTIDHMSTMFKDVYQTVDKLKDNFVEDVLE
jgi:archaellum component FlaC